jgi:hypothetical protein
MTSPEKQSPTEAGLCQQEITPFTRFTASNICRKDARKMLNTSYQKTLILATACLRKGRG